jgi:hypothetical protein
MTRTPQAFLWLAAVAAAFSWMIEGVPRSPTTWSTAAAQAAVATPPARPSVLFSSSFDRGMPRGIRFDAKNDGTWRVRQGRLHARLPNKKQQKSIAYIGSERWANYAVEADVCGLRGVDKGIAVRVVGDDGVGVDLRGGKYQDLLVYRGKTQIGQAPMPNRNGRWYRLRVEARGPAYRVYVNERLAFHYRDPSNDHRNGKLALAAYTGGEGQCAVAFDNVVVTQLGSNDSGRPVRAE